MFAQRAGHRSRPKLTHEVNHHSLKYTQGKLTKLYCWVKQAFYKWMMWCNFCELKGKKAQNKRHVFLGKGKGTRLPIGLRSWPWFLPSGRGMLIGGIENQKGTLLYLRCLTLNTTRRYSHVSCVRHLLFQAGSRFCCLLWARSCLGAEERGEQKVPDLGVDSVVRTSAGGNAMGKQSREGERRTRRGCVYSNSRQGQASPRGRRCSQGQTEGGALYTRGRKPHREAKANT